MIRFSEYVSLGHPDKTADYISQYLLDRYIERDPAARYAVEVQIKGTQVTLGGEVSSAVSFTPEQITAFVREAVCEIGYTRAYQRRWGAGNTICGEELEVAAHISQQSPDIARGLSGWGDQGIFFGCCINDSGGTCGMPYDHTAAKRLCKALFESGLGGLDIKTQVVTDGGDRITKVIVAIPLLSDKDTVAVEGFVRETLGGDYELIVNGTGRYVEHSSIADCGTTGRKLAVDMYGGNCLIGGGSPWTKDAGKADLNLAARRIAKTCARLYGCDTFVRLACCIGRKDVEMCVQDRAGKVLDEAVVEVDPARLRHEYRLDTPIYASMCRWGLFGEYQQDKVWEQEIK